MTKDEEFERTISDMNDKNNNLQAELGSLKLDMVTNDIIKRRLYRELDEKDDQLTDVTAQLRASEDSVTKGIMRFDRAMEHVKELEKRNEELLKKIEDDHVTFTAKLGGLKGIVEELERDFKLKEEECAVLKSEKVKFDGCLSELRINFEGLSRRKAEVDKKLLEFEGVRRRNVEFESEIMKMESHLQEMKVRGKEKEEKFGDLSRKNEVLESEIGKMERQLQEMEARGKEKEEKIGDLSRKNEVLEIEIGKMERKLQEMEARGKEKEEKAGDLLRMSAEFERIRMRNEVLEREKAELEARSVELRRGEQELKERHKKLMEWTHEFEGFINADKCRRIQLISTIKEKEEKITELEKEKAALVSENGDIMARTKKIEERYSKLEGDVIASLCFDLNTEKKLASSQVGKILCGILSMLDCEGVDAASGGEQEGVNIQGAGSSFVDRVNELNSSYKFGTNSEQASGKPSVLKEISSSEKTPSDIIQIDSDDDCDKSSPCDHKRRKYYSEGVIQARIGEDSSDASLNRKYKIKKLAEKQDVSLKHERSVTASGNRTDDKFGRYQSQSVATIRKCKGAIDGKVGGSK